MNFENPFNNPSEDLAKKLGTAAVVAGIGLAGMPEAHAADAVPQADHVQTVESTKVERDLDAKEFFQVLHKDADSIWGVELVPEKSEHGNRFVEKFVKVNLKNGEATVIGEFTNVLKAAKVLGEMKDIPKEVRAYAQIDADAIHKERDLQKTGLTDPGTNVKNPVEADTPDTK
jgi:hypothetical protein